MEMEIQSLLEKLLDINDSLSRCAASAAPTTTVTQKLARHREILHEYTQVYQFLRNFIFSNLLHCFFSVEDLIVTTTWSVMRTLVPMQLGKSNTGHLFQTQAPLSILIAMYKYRCCSYFNILFGKLLVCLLPFLCLILIILQELQVKYV